MLDCLVSALVTLTCSVCCVAAEAVCRFGVSSHDEGDPTMTRYETTIKNILKQELGLDFAPRSFCCCFFLSFFLQVKIQAALESNSNSDNYLKTQ